MNMYTPYFIAYIVGGLVLGLAAFAWALKSGQFKEQERARYLPLTRPEAPPAASRFGRLETYALLAMACCGLLLSAFTLIYSLLTAPS
jgi:cbb3-type cytochrome oxidase maturation protein